jgi:hypothetical protein
VINDQVWLVTPFESVGPLTSAETLVSLESKLGTKYGVGHWDGAEEYSWEFVKAFFAGGRLYWLEFISKYATLHLDGVALKGPLSRLLPKFGVALTDELVFQLAPGVRVGREVGKQTVQTVVVEFVEQQLIDDIVAHLYS